MSSYHWTAIAILAVAVVFAAWMFRYDTKAGAYTTSIVLDRWTGAVYQCGVFVDPDATRGCIRQN